MSGDRVAERAADAADDRPAELIRRLREAGLSVAVAESLTGGLVTAALVAVPGASAVVRGGVVAYATPLKAELLGVDAALLDAEGPVHRRVAEQLAEGARRRLAVDGEPAAVGLATTGVAGPDPQHGHRPGEVWIAVADAAGTVSRRLDLAGSRDEIRRATVGALLELALERVPE